MNENYDELEQKAAEEIKPKKPKMKVSGKSVFVLESASKKIDKKK